MGLLLALVSKLSTAARRLVLGRPFRSDRLAHTLLPKRIALPVFASDALSSVAYAPEEIFLVLSVAGLAAYSMAPWIGLAVAAVMLIVIASYRQNVHAYPSGGGDYEVVTTNLGHTAGLTVASAPPPVFPTASGCPWWPATMETSAPAPSSVHVGEGFVRPMPWRH